MSAKFRRGRGSQMNKQDRQEIQELALVQGLSQAEIARRTGRDRGTVASVLNGADTKDLEGQLAAGQREAALLILRRNASATANAWVTAVSVAADKGDHRPSRDLLLHTGVIQPIDSPGPGRTSIAVIIGLAGQPSQVVEAPAVTVEQRQGNDNEGGQ